MLTGGDRRVPNLSQCDKKDESKLTLFCIHPNFLPYPAKGVPRVTEYTGLNKLL